MSFAFEKLMVYQKALDFSIAVIQVIDEIDTPRKHYKLIEPLEASCTSVCLNIAEGRGDFQKGNLNSSFTSPEAHSTRPSPCFRSLRRRIGYRTRLTRTCTAR
jgi:hypothetical protein